MKRGPRRPRTTLEIPPALERLRVHADAARWLDALPALVSAVARDWIAPIVRSFELGHSRAHVLGRLDRLCAELGLDRARATGWTIAQTVAWGFSSDLSPRHLETARWLFERS